MFEAGELHRDDVHEMLDPGEIIGVARVQATKEFDRSVTIVG